MAFLAHLIVDGKAEFNVMESYYHMFPHEMSRTHNFIYNLPNVTRIKDITYEKILDKMIDLRTTSPSIDNFVIVVHGLHDSKDFGWGFAMPVTDGTLMKASYEVLKPLVDFRNAEASDKAMDEFEGNYSYTNPNLNLSNVKFPPGSVARIVGKMARLQKLKVRIVELRACTLGSNKPGMEIIGQSMGARFLLAPDRHMFYVSIDVQHGFNRGPVFDRMLTLIPRARRFENPTNAAERLAISVQRGGGVSFVTVNLVNTPNLGWFVNGKLWVDNNYVNGTTTPRNFFMPGMDLLGGNYALPQEQAYCDHLIEVGPLVGNLI